MDNGLGTMDTWNRNNKQYGTMNRVKLDRTKGIEMKVFSLMQKAQKCWLHRVSKLVTSLLY